MILNWLISRAYTIFQFVNSNVKLPSDHKRKRYQKILETWKEISPAWGPDDILLVAVYAIKES